LTKPKILTIAILVVILGSATFLAGEQVGAAGVDGHISAELKATDQGNGLLGAPPDYSSYAASLEQTCNAQLPALQNMSDRLKTINSQLQQYAALPYNSTAAAEIQALSAQSQALQGQIQLAMTQINQCWSVVSSILQSLHQTMQTINGTVRGR
jgi:hypothetical protein